MQFRPKRYWTPRYIYDRLLLHRDQQRNPDNPWWPREARRLLDGMLKPTDRMLEWGSGRSTAWLSQRVGTVRSIEHDAEWFEIVQKDLAGLGNGSSVELLSTESSNGSPENSPYVRVIDEFEDGELTVVLVDGELRAECARAATGKLASGGVLIVDDACWFIDHPTRSPHSRRGKGHHPDWAEFVEEVKPWRWAWTTDGVTDTAIFVKP